MKKPRYFLWIAAVEITGFLSGFFSREGTAFYEANVRKPPLTPPGILFPVVWAILYALMGIGAARVAASDRGVSRSRGLNLFVIQLLFNFFWSLIFFNVRNYGFALLWLLAMWALIIAMTLQFRKVDRAAALLQIPYLLWVTYAAYLNFGVWQLNR